MAAVPVNMRLLSVEGSGLQHPYHRSDSGRRLSERITDTWFFFLAGSLSIVEVGFVKSRSSDVQWSIRVQNEFPAAFIILTQRNRHEPLQAFPYVFNCLCHLPDEVIFICDDGCVWKASNRCILLQQKNVGSVLFSTPQHSV